MSVEPEEAPRPRRSPSSPRLTPRGKLVAAVAGVSAVVLVIALTTRRGGGSPAAHRSSPSTGGTPTTASTETSSAHRTVTTGAAQQAQAALASLIALAPSGGVSVAVRDVTSDREYTAGATSGMSSASVAKVEILETMLLQHGGALTDEDNDLATDMIEHSDNDAADDCFARLGGATAYSAALPRLGLDPRLTVADQGYYWGLNRTSAPQQVILLGNLVDDDSPLSKPARDYALTLMRHVEADQRWGVPSVADPGTPAANKNGWLNIDSDHGLWAVNSDGIVTVHGHVLLMSVLTQHDTDFEAGTAHVDALVKQLAVAVLS